ncbi:MAG TPA: hypothetical protein VE173_06985, partial [Longimicrobiales bacterium]|nr:hypothetical protein [Longimicrobiales bacterium]
MSADALCLRCRGPLNEDGLCPACDAEEVEVASRLRQLREEIARERGDLPPAEPRSRLWRRTKEKLERAKREAEAGARPAPRKPPATGREEPGPPAGKDSGTGESGKSALAGKEAGPPGSGRSAAGDEAP